MFAQQRDPTTSHPPEPRADEDRGASAESASLERSAHGYGVSPFQRAGSLNKRLKLFLWGDSGAGKTTLALRSPSPVVIDLERGTDLYGGKFEFDVRHATTADEVSNAVDWLLANEHPYETLVIDPISVYWDALQKKWSDIFLKRNKRSKGHKFEFYDFQPRDWMTIKAEFKGFVRKLVALDMNVVVTARQKTRYADGGFMRAVGETFDGEKSLPYLFDTIVRLYRNEKGEFGGECLKDRSGRLLSGRPLLIDEGFWDLLKGSPETTATPEQKQQILKLVTRLGMTLDQLNERLPDYGASSLDDLASVRAVVILKKLNHALEGGVNNATS